MRRFLSSVCRWLRDTSKARPSVRLGLEQLEDRLVPTVTYHGGPPLPHVQASVLFYGSDWTANPALDVQANAIGSYLGYIVQSPYMDMLTNAGYGVGRGKLVGSAFDGSDVSGGASADQVQVTIQADINAGILPSPNANNLYFVFLPPDAAVFGDDGSVTEGGDGYHTSFEGNDANQNPIVIQYAVVTSSSDVDPARPVDTYTLTASHELAEAVTDPTVPGGWYDDSYTSEGEIGDVVNGQAVFLNGWWVQKEADQNDQPMVPYGATSTPEPILTLSSQPLNVQPGQPLTQVVASFTDTSLSATLGWFGASINWGDGTTSAGAIVENGDGSFDVLGTHTYAAGIYSATVFVKGGDGAAATTVDPVAALAPTRAGQPFFTMDGAGALWEYTNGSGWLPTGGIGQSFQVGTDAAGSSEAWVLAGGYLYRYDQGGWAFTGGRLQNVEAGHAEAFGVGYDGQLWRFSDYTGWTATGGFGQSFVLGTDLGGQDEVWVLAGAYLYRYDAGMWLSTGGALRSLAAGHGEVFGLGFDGQLWRFRDWGGWTATGGYGQTMQVGLDAAEQDEVWLLAGSVLYRYDGGSWASTGGSLQSLAAGQGETYGIGFEGELWRFSDYTGWMATGGFGQLAGSGTDVNGLDVAWIRAADGGFWLFDQGTWNSVGRPV